MNVRRISSVPFSVNCEPGNGALPDKPNLASQTPSAVSIRLTPRKISLKPATKTSPQTSSTTRCLNSELEQEALFATKLDRWLDESAVPEKSARTIAVNTIKRARDDKVQTLKLDGLGLTSLPDCLNLLPSVKSLEVRDNFLTEIGRVPPNLEALKAGDNCLKALPEDLPQTLRILSIYRNALSKIPTLPENLEHLDVYENALTALPFFPKSLRHVSAHGNRLSVIPYVHDAVILLNLSNNCFEFSSDHPLNGVQKLSNSALVIRDYQKNA